jgi:hypothetical protein
MDKEDGARELARRVMVKSSNSENFEINLKFILKTISESSNNSEA